jgi:glycosyltransferase involved in cell wall biosynthesis
MKLIILNRYFHPDESATGRMASSLAFGLADRGWDLHAVSSRQLLGTPDASLPSQEEVDGVTVHRIWTSRFGRRRILGRVFDYATYYISAFFWLLKFARRGDMMIVATDPPLLSVLASAAATFTGTTRVNWLHDLYPEVAVGLGVSMPGAGYRLLQWLRDRSMRGAAMNVAIGRRMAEYVRGRGVLPGLISVIHNWSDGLSIRPLPPLDNALRQQWGLTGKFVVGYSGNMGRGHDFGTILRAAKALEGQTDVAFLFIGAGHQLSLIQEQARALHLLNIVLRPYQPSSQLTESLCVPDVHLVSLKPALENFMVPCKFYGAAAAGRPTIYIGDVTGEIPAILRDADCGSAVEVGDVDGLVECIARLRQSPEQAERWSRNAREVLLRQFDRHLAIDRWCAVLDRLIARPAILYPRVAKVEE